MTNVPGQLRESGIGCDVAVCHDFALTQRSDDCENLLVT